MLNFLLNKGGAGVSISRSETVERLNPIIRRHIELNHYYDHAIGDAAGRDVSARLEEYQKTARADVGKLAESVYSAGGVAFTGTDLDPDAYRLQGDPDEVLFGLQEQEASLLEALADELKVRHHIRTLAILGNVRTNAQARLNYLKEATRGRKRAARTPETLKANQDV
jgi:hypothetical protein